MASKQWAGLALLIAGCALLFGILGSAIARRAAEHHAFQGKRVEVTRGLFPIDVASTHKGKPYAEVRGVTRRLSISKGDYKLLTAAESVSGQVHYCLPLTFERAGGAVRLRLPSAPRPSRTRRTITIVRCADQGPPTRILS